ncbi:glycoside hydrolase family 78 protein [Microbacterium sp. TPD7012]|uniref:glycoside hydrolase family 78 protein n=1 Tax=Microbacterium sp. TPD7012 TaxID=2171975 RepID=UPI000D5121EF|nr:glycoside hydrolase family 78 protein [Microbacterium sp. TPD7012]PVE96809.1 alpha-L-rhamnosidase [Microbacterium sp. TPD7012]
MSIVVAAPTFEHHRHALGIGESAPRISWKTQASAGWRQASYELEVTRGDEVSTASATDEDSVLRAWPWHPLASRERAVVRVRVSGDDGSVSDWSEPAAVEAGLLEPGDWSALAVGANWNENPLSDERRPSVLRRDFAARGGLVSARLYVTAHGVYEVEINGNRVGDDAMSPGWTPYRQKLRYYTYDVTDAIDEGPNAIGAWLGDGWYRGRMGWRGGFRNVFGTDLSLLAQLELRYADGSTETIVTDGDWRAAPSPILHTGNYDGETYDARVAAEIAGWSRPGFDAAGWSRVVAAHRDPATLTAPEGPPVRCTQEVAPVELLTTPSGRRVLDFGQNLVGRPRFRVTGQAGDVVRFRTAEVLQQGEIYTRPLRDAKSTDEYVLAGDGVEEWEPRFTFHGFRYAEIEWPGDADALDAAVAAGDIVARVYHTDMERTGWFESSNAQVDRLHENVVWSMRGNFLDIPTDCPQRDERIGWTGDLQVFAPTASFLYDVSGMLSSWLKDVAIEQLPDGTVPWYVPVIPADKQWTPIRPGAAWGDVATFTPWTLYERFGDTRILRDQYESAKKWVDLLERLAGEDRLWDEGFQLGDWLDPAAPPEDPADATTDRYLVATAYFARSADRVARMAEVLGHDDDRARYAELAAEVRAAFTATYVREDGRMTSDAQTAYSLAIAFELVSDEHLATAGARLAELVEEAGHRIATGFVGTPLVSDALTVTGHADAAYDLLLETEAPSWLYAVLQGGTTIWERWDSLRPDGTVNPGTMTSFNHYALGAVADWLHRTVAGLAPAAPGYRSIRFAPTPGGGFTHARAAHETPYGRAEIAWRVDGGSLRVDVTVPTGTTATVELPGGERHEVGSGSHRIEGAWSARTLSASGDDSRS